MTTYTVTSDVFPAVFVLTPPTHSETSPATIYAPDKVLVSTLSTKLHKVRVITLELPKPTILVYVDSPQGPHLAHEYPLATFNPALPHAARFTTQRRSTTPEYTASATDGTTFAYYKMGSCGCGSRLKGFNPFSSLTAVASRLDSRATATPAPAD